MGDNLQKMTFIFDTGSAWTWLPNQNCPSEECKGNKLRDDSSDGNDKEVFYGIGYIKGKIGQTDISITPEIKTQAEKVNFLSVYTAKDMTDLVADGLLGLSPHVDSWDSWANPDKTVHLLVNQLYQDEVIEKPIFALYLTEFTSQSKIHFGGYDKSIVN